MKRWILIVAGMILPFCGSAQWSKKPDLTYHCATCMDIPDMAVTPGALTMPGFLGADITLCDSLGRELEVLTCVRFNSTADSAATAYIFNFITRRDGYLEMILYRPTAWSPKELESFTYIVPTVKREKEERYRF